MESGTKVVDGVGMESSGEQEAIVGSPSPPAINVVTEDISGDAGGVETSGDFYTLGIEIEPTIAASRANDNARGGSLDREAVEVGAGGEMEDGGQGERVNALV